MSNNKEQALALAIGDEIKRRAGGRMQIGPHYEFGYHKLLWIYDCPCGEQSFYEVILHERVDRIRDPNQFIAYQVDVALEVMRRHVRSEGNEPTF